MFSYKFGWQVFFVQKPSRAAALDVGAMDGGIPSQNLNTLNIRKKKPVYHVISWYVIVTSYALWNIRVDVVLVATKYTQDRRSGLLLRHRWNCIFHLLKLGTLKSSFSSGEMWWNRGMRLHGICDAWCFENMEHQSHAGKKSEFLEWHHSRIPMAFFGGNTERSAIRIFQTLSLLELSRSLPWS